VKPSLRNNLRVPSCEMRLRSPMWSVAFLAVLAIPSALLIWETSRIVLAQIWGASADPAAIRRAIALDPGNADLHCALGRVLLLDVRPGAQSEAVQEFQKATILNPRSAVYWSSLGKACYASGNQTCAEAAFIRAQELAPSNPQYAWQSAVNYVVSNQPDAAVERLKMYLQLRHDGIGPSFELLMRGFGDPKIVTHRLLAPSSDMATKLQVLSYLAGDKDFDAANDYWTELVANKSEISVAGVTPYVDGLLAGRRYQDAAGAWRYAQGDKGLGRLPTSSEQNLVYNSGFEQDPLNGGFDWHSLQQPYVNVDFADHNEHSGLRSILAEFTVPQNTELEWTYQLVPVVPATTYELTAYVESRTITSDSGPRLRVVDPECVACLDVATPGTTGTTDWHQVTTQFTTGQKTEVIRLSLWRPRSRTYPMEISGQSWFDDISLHPAASPIQETASRGNR